MEAVTISIVLGILIFSLIAEPLVTIAFIGAVLIILGICFIVDALIGPEEIKRLKEKEKKPVRVIFRPSEVFELEKGEGIIWEELGAKNGRWNASCITTRYIRLKRRGKIICIPLEQIECLEYQISRREYSNEEDYDLIVYSKKQPPHHVGLWYRKTIDTLLPAVLDRRRPSGSEKEDYPQLMKKLLEETGELIEYTGTKYGPQVFVKGEFIRRTEKLLRTYFMAQIAGQHRWLQDIYINPVLLFTDWMVALTRTGTILIRPQHIYLVYLERLFQWKSRQVSHHSRYDAPPRYSQETWREHLQTNLTLYTLLGTYSFEDVNYKRTILYLSSLND